MSATLYREGSNLDELLAELDAEHGGSVRVVDIDHGRDGGVMGFFAHRRIGVHYVVNDPVNSAGGAPDNDISVPPVEQPTESPLDELLRAADAAEMIESGRAPVTAAAVVGHDENVEFARMLLEMAGQKAAERATRAAAEAPVTPATPLSVTPPPAAPLPAAPLSAAPLAAAPPSVTPARAAQRQTFEVHLRGAQLPAVRTAARAADPPLSAGRHRAGPEPLPTTRRTYPSRTDRDVAPTTRRPAPAPRPAPFPAEPAARPARPAPDRPADTVTTSPPDTPTRTSYTLRRQLAELGVPVGRIPEHDNAFLVIEHLVSQAPSAHDVDPEPGHLVVVAGPARHVLVEATRLCTRLRLDPARLHTAGFGDSPIAHRRDAVALAHRVRADAAEICIVAIATDATAAEADASGRDDLAWAASLVVALTPDHLVVVVDATSKPADARSMLAALGPATALAVVGAGRTASPASLWDLGVGVVSLDGRPATRGAWAALLIDRLADLDLV